MAYREELKGGAARLVMDGRRKVRDVCRELGIYENLLHCWKNEYQADRNMHFPGKSI